MKTVIFLFGVAIHSLPLFSQSEDVPTEKRLKYGFNFGANYSNVLAPDGLSDNAQLSNQAGIRLGVLADYKISDFLSIAPRVEMSFNNGKVQFTNPDNTQTDYQIMPIGIDFMTHFIFKKENENLSPYFLIGPDFKLPITKENDDPSYYPTNNDFAIDFGIGLDKTFTYFSFSPEIRYSFGLLNVNQHPSVQSIRFHNISLVLNFIG